MFDKGKICKEKIFHFYKMANGEFPHAPESSFSVCASKMQYTTSLFAHDFFFFFFLLEHSSHKRTMILPYVSPFLWYTQAAGTRYTPLRLSLSALRSLWKIFTHTLPFPLISTFQPQTFSEPVLDFFRLPLTSATVIVNSSEYLDSIPSQTSSAPLPKALGVWPSLCAGTIEILGS